MTNACMLSLIPVSSLCVALFSVQRQYHPHTHRIRRRHLLCLLASAVTHILSHTHTDTEAAHPLLSGIGNSLACDRQNIAMEMTGRVDME